jgi:hypothetical protein
MTSNGVFVSDTQVIPAVSATGESNADGVDASSTGGIGVSATSGEGPGIVAATSNGPAGLIANNEGTGQGVFASSLQGIGLLAVSGEGFETPPAVQAAIATQSLGSSSVGLFAVTTDGVAVSASDEGSGTGVQASSASGTAVFAQSGTGTVAHPPPGIGVHAVGGGTSATTRISQAGIFAEGGSGNGVVALTTNGTAVTAIEDGGGNGVSALSNGGVAVLATANGGGNGVNATSDSAAAVGASSNSGTGVEASSQSGPGVSGASVSGSGVQGHSDTSTGVSGVTESGFGVTANGGSAGVALQVIGKVEVQGKSVGSVAMAAGTKTLKVNNAAATANSLIFLTPLEDPQAFLWIGARNAGSFTIDTSKALPAKVTIVFLIIN